MRSVDNWFGYSFSTQFKKAFIARRRDSGLFQRHRGSRKASDKGPSSGAVCCRSGSTASGSASDEKEEERGAAAGEDLVGSLAAPRVGGELADAAREAKEVIRRLGDALGASFPLQQRSPRVLESSYGVAITVKARYLTRARSELRRHLVMQ